MTINFIPNDPLAKSHATPRARSPRPNRPSSRAGITMAGPSQPEKAYATGTPGFLFWQTREAAIAAIEVFEAVNGPLSSWAAGRKLLVEPNRGVDLNAYYNRASVAFFQNTTGTKTTFSGASTDVVAHEIGHGLLDAFRADLWDSNYGEVAAFHEAFGDCIAILTALSDKTQRTALIGAVPTLWAENFVEATAEDLSDGIRRALGASHPAAAPRHAFNWFEWALPGSLPSDAPPAQLSSESHSFARVFTGCFWDLLGNLWNGHPSGTEAALWECALTAGRLLVAGARGASDTPRFFRSVGEAMLLADAQDGGSNATAITEAFAFHNVALSATAAVAPVAFLGGSPPRHKAGVAAIDRAARADLVKRFNLHDNVGFLSRPLTNDISELTVRRAVDLTGVSAGLTGVVAVATQPILLGTVNKKAAVLGAVPQKEIFDEEVRQYVQGLADRDAIAYGGAAAPGAGAVGLAGTKTHEVVVVDGGRVLRRAQFACGGR